MPNEGSERRGDGGLRHHHVQDSGPHHHDTLEFLAKYCKVPFFHDGQQSAQMQDEHSRRLRLLHDQKRQADIDSQLRKGIVLQQLPMLNLERTRVTLCIDLCSAKFFLSSKSCSSGMAALLRESAGKAIIKLPDAESTVPDLIHQMTITGELHEVERVRQRIRALTPLTLSVPVIQGTMNLSAIGIWLALALQNGTLPFPQLSITLQEHVRPFIDISGPACEETAILSATRIIIRELYKAEDAEAVQVGTAIEVAAAHRQLLFGKPDVSLVLLISKETNANVHFPLHTENGPLTISVMCSGAPHAVLAARRYILGLLPMQLCLDIDDSLLPQPADQRSKRSWSQEYNVSVRIDRSDLEPRVRLSAENMRHFVCLCAHEHCVAELFLIGAHLLQQAVPPFMASTLPHAIRSQLGHLVGPIYAACRVYPQSEMQLPEAAAAMGAAPPEMMPPSLRVPPPPPSAPSERSRHSSERENPFLDSLDEGHRRLRHHDPQSVFNDHFRGRQRGELLRGETPKHTLELRPRTFRNERNPHERNSHERNPPVNYRRSEMDRNDLPLRERRGYRPPHPPVEERAEPAPSRTSYADVLQQKRMDPMRLIELAGEEAAAKGGEGGERAKLLPPPEAPASTYAEVVRAAEREKALRTSNNTVEDSANEHLHTSMSAASESGFAAGLSFS